MKLNHFDLENTILVWEALNTPREIMEKIKEKYSMNHASYVAFVPENICMKHGLPTWMSHNKLFCKRFEVVLYEKGTLVVGYWNT